MIYTIKEGEREFKPKGLLNKINTWIDKVADEKGSNLSRVHSFMFSLDDDMWVDGDVLYRICGVAVGQSEVFNSVSMYVRPSFRSDGISPVFHLILNTFVGGIKNETVIAYFSPNEDVLVDFNIDHSSTYDGHKRTQHDWAMNVYVKIGGHETHRGVMFRGESPLQAEELVTKAKLLYPKMISGFAEKDGTLEIDLL